MKIKRVIAAALAVLVLSTAFISTAFAEEQTGGTVKPEPAKIWKISSQSKGLKLQWNPVKNADSYEVYRSEKANGKWILAGAAKNCSFTDNTVKAGKVYYYSVASRNGNKKSTVGKYAKKGYFIKSPKLKSVTSTQNGMKVSWKKTEHASAYRVYRILDSGRLHLIGTTTSTSFTDTKAEDRTKYQYTVKAYNNSCKTCFSNYNKQGLKAKYLDPVRVKARKRLKACGGTLRKAFDWASHIHYVPNEHGATTKANANWTFTHLKGDCMGKAAAFCLMARELGYEAYMISGVVPIASGGYSPHAWVEIKIKGVWYVCDPSFDNSTRNGYKIHYGQPGTWKYMNYHRAR